MSEDNKKHSGGSGHQGHSQRPIDDVSAETYSWWKKNYVLIKKARVRTWQGVFLLAFIIGAAVALIWTISTNIHQFLKAEGETATMRLSTVESVVVNETFAVHITVDAGANHIVAARAMVNYDANDLELTDCSTVDSAFYDSAESCLATSANEFRIVNNETPGVFDITVAKPTPGVTDNGRMVATLTFKAKRVTSQSNISLAFSDVAGEDNYTDSDVILDDRKGTDILISVIPDAVAIGSALCTASSYSYSEFGACQTGGTFTGFNGYRTRIITGQIPADCVAGVLPEPLEEGCNIIDPPKTLCDSTRYVYTAWGACQVTNSRTRAVTASSPTGCDQRNAVTSEACIYPNLPPVVIDPQGHKVDAPKIKVGDGERIKLKSSKKFYSKEEKFSFKGKIEGLAGGTIKAYVDGDLDKEIKLNNKGEWSFSKKGKNGKTYGIKFVYFNSTGQEVDDSSKYEVEVDTKDPEFTDLPLALNKRPGSKVWWTAEDNHKLDSFKVEFNGKEKEMKDPSFVIPANTPKGMHWMVVKAYDKAGNKEIRRVLIRIR